MSDSNEVHFSAHKTNSKNLTESIKMIKRPTQRTNAPIPSTYLSSQRKPKKPAKFYENHQALEFAIEHTSGKLPTERTPQVLDL